MAKHFITLDDTSPQAFMDLLAVARYLKQRRGAGIPEHVCAGRTLAMIFEKPSLRTRLSFEMAMAELGGRTIYVKGDEVGLGKREPVEDVARVLGRYVQGIMARVFRHADVEALAQYAGVPVINGLSDTDHPCQALADLLTVQEHLGRTEGVTIAYIGDANNVCRSLARACVLAGARCVIASPEGYTVGEADAKAFGSAWGSQVVQVRDPAAAAQGAQVLYTDVWTSMGQESERERRLKDFHGYQIDEALLARAAPECRIMHCLPAHRGEEISAGAMEHPRSIVFDQAENRLHAQKAILRLLLCPDADRVLAAAKG